MAPASELTFACKPPALRHRHRLRSNANLTGGLYFGITKSVTLTAELSHTTSKSFAGDTAKLDGAAVGAILFF